MILASNFKYYRNVATIVEVKDRIVKITIGKKEILCHYHTDSERVSKIYIALNGEYNDNDDTNNTPRLKVSIL